MKKKGWIIGGLALALLAGAGWVGREYVARQMGEQVLQTVKDPAVQKQIAEAVKQQQLTQKLPQAQAKEQKSGSQSGQSSSAAQESATGTGRNSASASSTGLYFASREEAVQFAMSRFTTAEIARYSAAYANRKNLSAAEKRAIKAEILSRFTPQELIALQQAVSR